MSYKFGTVSLSRLATAEPELGRVFHEVIKHVDCSILEGARTDDLQYEYFRQGKTTKDGVYKRSKHQVSADKPLSRAVDVIPYPQVRHGINVWQDDFRFTLFAGEVIACGWSVGVALTWGGDWNGDGSRADQLFHDLPHFELK
jgi:peptidoglycan LD-endopeptidase CwlK